MIYNVRTYNCVPRMLNKYVKIFEDYAMPVNNKYGFKPIAYFISDIGPQNQIVHIWEYKDLEEFNTMKKKRAADPDWLSFRDKTAGMVADQEDKIMTGTSFSPLK